MSQMLDEIRQQPVAIERTLQSELRHAESLRSRYSKKRPRMVVLAARGTSDNAAQFGRYLIEITTGIPVSLAAPSIFTLYGTGMHLQDALVVGLSQSGQSTDTNLVLERSRSLGAQTIGITNEPVSATVSIADECFLVHAGPENSVAATKTYTGQMMALYLLAYALGADLNIDSLQRIPEYVQTALKLEREIRPLAARYVEIDRAVVVGRGFNYANALEFALKLMETCYVVAERFSSADLLHGPIAMIDEQFPAFLFAPSGVTSPAMSDIIERLDEIGADTLIISDQSNREVGAKALRIPAMLPELLSPIPYIVPAQLFTAMLAVDKGLDPDRPRALQKVTRTL